MMCYWCVAVLALLGLLERRSFAPPTSTHDLLNHEFAPFLRAFWASGVDRVHPPAQTARQSQEMTARHQHTVTLAATFTSRTMSPSMNFSRTSAPLALPPSSSASKKGALIVSVLSANDFSQQHPVAVSLQVAGATVRTGPPSARHVNGINTCYRFDSSQGLLRVDAPLATLYKSKAVLTVECTNSQDVTLSGVLDCNKLCIQDTAFITLHLSRNSTPPQVTTTIRPAAHENDNEQTTTMTSTPTLSIQVRLEGPLRTEIVALLNLSRAWFQVVDTVEDALTPFLQHVPSAKYLSALLLIPSVPVLTGILVVSPILIGLGILLLPILLPLFILLGIIVLSWMCAGGFVLASTRMGRLYIDNTLSPLYQTLLSQPPAQIMIYNTGSRPTPVTLVQSYLPTDLIGKFCMSLFMDTVGSCSYLLPILGESFDVIWCPCQTLLIKAMYQDVTPNLTYVSFVEEFLPFTDVLPTATIGWMSEFGPELLQLLKQNVVMEKSVGGMQVLSRNKGTSLQ